MEAERHRGMMANELKFPYENVWIFRLLWDKSKFFSRKNKMRIESGNSCYYSGQTLVSNFFLKI